MILENILRDFIPLYESQAPVSVVLLKAFQKGFDRHVLMSGKFKKSQVQTIKDQIDMAVALFKSGQEMTFSSPNPLKDSSGKDMPYNCHVYKASDKKGLSYYGDFWVLGKLHVFWTKYPSKGMVEFFGFGFPGEYGF